MFTVMKHMAMKAAPVAAVGVAMAAAVQQEKEQAQVKQIPGATCRNFTMYNPAGCWQKFEFCEPPKPSAKNSMK